jgi:hypothetical protein
LLLRQDCPLIDAGCDYIDEHPQLIGKTTFVYPDTNMVNIGFHYPNWNYVNDGSGSADLDYSMTADLKDFAILANYWQQETSGAADLDGSGFVDSLDLALFAEGWQRTEVMYVEGYSFDMHQSVDFNNVAGNISIGPGNIPSDADKVFVYVDDVQVSKWERGISEWNGFLESDKFTNGRHTIRLVSINLNDSITNYQPINAYFNNLLYKVSADKQFYPDENYRYSGFYDGGDSLEVKLTGLHDNVIWSNAYSGSYIDVNIPGSVFGPEKFCKINITETTGAMMATMGENGTAMASSSSGSVSEEDLTKKFKMEDSAGVRMLIIMPNEDIFSSRLPALLACAQACDDRQVLWVPLYHHDVSEENLTYLYNQDSVKFIYWAGHGDCNVPHEGGVPRTHTECWRYEPSWWHSDWQIIKVLSWTRQAMDDAPLLPGNWDTRGFDLWLLGMHDSGKKKIVFADSCFSALPYMGLINDMSAAYGTNFPEVHDQIYIGWRIGVKQEAMLDILAGDTTAGIKLFWQRMGVGDSVEEALQWTCDRPISEQMLRTMWGLLNPHTEFGDVDGDDNIFLWGNGLGNYQIKLEP